MEVLNSWGTWASNALSAYSIQLPFNLFPPSIDVSAELGVFLSQNASIHLPGTSRFDFVTDRWQSYMDPTFSIAVEVAAESDVQATVKFANEHGIPFLAVSGGHGTMDSMASMEGGVEIWMRGLNTVRVFEDGQNATFGGGVIAKELIDALYAVGKQAVTGVCECPGVMGVILGGGHGILQGKYGVGSDNLLSARVVLANGTAVTASSTENEDLLWALRGAGHNFGVVTEFTLKIHDIPEDDLWSYENIIFSGDKIGPVFKTVNELMDVQPAEMTIYVFFVRIPEIDPVNMSAIVFIFFQGSVLALEKYTAPFHALKPVVIQPGTAKYTDHPRIFGGSHLEGQNCQHGSTTMRFPVGMKRYNPAVQQKVYDYYNKATNDISEFAGSIFLFESYPMQAVQAIDPLSTAFPHREDDLLVSPLLIYRPNASLDAAAVKIGTDIRKIILNGIEGENKELRAYVNYAHGDETVEQIYGEPWRVEKLRMLKKKFDPKNAFRFYGPVM